MNVSDDSHKLTAAFHPGDRVQVVQGKHLGKFGTVVEVRGDRVAVRSDNYPDGKPALFKPGYLKKLTVPGGVPAEVWFDKKISVVPEGLQPAAPSDPVDPEGLQEAARQAASAIKPVDLEGLHQPENSDPPTVEPVDLEGLHPDSDPVDPEGLQVTGSESEPVDLEGLQTAIAVLEKERTRLSSTALCNCWLKSFKRGERGYTRLCYAKSLNKSPEYVAAKDYTTYQERINQGRQLKALEGALAYLYQRMENADEQTTPR